MPDEPTSPSQPHLQTGFWFSFWSPSKLHRVPSPEAFCQSPPRSGCPIPPLAARRGTVLSVTFYPGIKQGQTNQQSPMLASRVRGNESSFTRCQVWGSHQRCPEMPDGARAQGHTNCSSTSSKANDKIEKNPYLSPFFKASKIFFTCSGFGSQMSAPFCREL